MKARIIFLVMAVLVMAVTAGCGIPDGTESSEAETTAAAETASTPTALISATPELTAEETATTAPETPTETVAATPTATAQPEPLTVSEGTLVYSNEDVSVGVVYPVISGMTDVVVQSGINTGVLSYLTDKANEVETEAADAADPHGTYTFNADFEVKRNDGVVLSIYITISFYTGGANVGSEAAFINVINSNPAQQPTLDELFTEGADYATVLNGKITTIIAAMDDADAYSFTGVEPHGGYYLTNTSLVIVFPRYTIAPGVYGEPEFVIPLAELSDILIPELA